MRRAAVAIAALVAFFASGAVAHAAERIARVDLFPSQPRVGDKVTIQLRPFWVLVDGTRPPALFAEDYPWGFAATSPSGRHFRIRLGRAPDNPYLWRGAFRFRSRGSWTVCALSGRSCLPRSSQRMHVRRRTARFDVWQQLERPFHMPTIALGSTCPTTAPDARGDLTRIGFVGTAWGDGPAYPGLGPEPVLDYLDPIPRESLFYGSQWFGEKVLWMMDPVYSGPMLVHGLQLDGPNELRFDRGIIPPRAMRIIRGSRRPRSRASFTRVRAPGCYAYQVDGLGFSKVIVFQAQPL
jgi:hypothetical protein